MISTTRRSFVRASASGLSLLPAAAQSPAPRRLSANDKVRFATIGIGIMGTGDTQTALETGLTELAAVCDVYQGRLTRAREVWGSKLTITRDYREILDRPDIDAVIIATPDHWHAQIATEAMNKGKDVYVEKPMVQKAAEGHGLIETARRTNRIVQVGSQRVSSIVYQKARELITAGAIGEINMIEAWYDRNSATGAWQYTLPTDASPETVDWERFLGNAPKRPFDPLRIFRWRNYQEYGTGVAGDLFVHLFTGIHYVLGSNGPNRIFGTGGLRFWKDGRDVPDVVLGLYDYPKTSQHAAFNLGLRVNFVCGGPSKSGFRFVGKEGIMMLETNSVSVSKTPSEREPGYTIETFAKATQERYLKDYRAKYPPHRPTAASLTANDAETFVAPRGYADRIDHHRNFFESVRSRKPLIEDATFGLRAAGPALATNVSYFERRVVTWDPESMKEVS